MQEKKTETPHQFNKRLIREILIWFLGGVLLFAAMFLLIRYV